MRLVATELSLLAARSAKICGAALLFALVFACAAFAEPKFPELTGRIVDNANLISPEDRTAIEAELKALEDKSTDQLVVVTLPSLQGYEIEDFGYQLGRKWGIGQAGKDNGVLLIVAPNERKVRIEVGRGLEGDVTDLMSKLIIENAILPAFRRGDFSGGIRAGVRDVKDVLLGDAEAVKKRAQGGRPAPGIDWVHVIILAFWLGIVVYVIWAHYREAQRLQRLPPSARRRLEQQRQRRSNNDVIVLPGGWGGSGGWDGGGSGGGWSGGGGGSFGGGGGSGSW